MAFSDRMEAVFELLDCSNAQIAALSAIDPSGVSRFRRGERIPTLRSRQFQKLCAGLVLFARQQGKYDELSQLCGDELSIWLLSDTGGMRLGKPVGRFFADKLNALMDLLNISNARLANAVKVDASVISRLRNRVRPPSGDDFLLYACEYFYARALASELLEELCVLTGLSGNAEPEAAAVYLRDWLSDRDFTGSERAMDKLLENMDSFVHDAYPPLPPLELAAPQEVLAEAADRYYGTEGLRRAVVRFLGTAASSGTPGELLLYSDQSMEWLDGDEGFKKQWAALMVYTLRARNRIKIIHNLGRSLPELLSAITNWLPLYFSGLLESWYHSKSADGRFSNTIFLSEHGAIVASVVQGTEDRGEYHYITGERLRYYREQYDALMASSRPFVQMFAGGEQKGLLFRLGEMARQSGQSQKLLSAPSLETMSEQTLERILARVESDNETAQRVREYHREKRGLLEQELSADGVCEYVYLPADELLFGGEVPLGGLFLGQSLFYAPEEYAAHLADIIALLEQNANYRFVPITDKPFESLQLYVKDEVGVIVFKGGAAPVASSFGHPFMARAYLEYIDHIARRGSLVQNREEAISLLRGYVVL